MYHFQARDKRGLFVDLLLNNKGWHKTFFVVSGEGWEYPFEEENPVRVLCAWGSPLQRGMGLEPAQVEVL